jgi:DnaJ-domain-containing protein 1
MFMRSPCLSHNGCAGSARLLVDFVNRVVFTRFLSVLLHNNTGLPLSRRPLKVVRMNLNSRLFDRIRVKSASAAADPVVVPCNHPGCKAEGVFRAPMGREREGQYFSFCKDHVREYNETYDYFRGMNDEALAKFQKDDIVGHRPTWPLGAKRGARPGPEQTDESMFGEARVNRRRGAGRSGKYKHEPRYNLLAVKALAVLELDARADEAVIKTRYKELVKRHHPDANGGDRSSEEKLREIIQAYNYLRANKLV